MCYLCMTGHLENIASIRYTNQMLTHIIYDIKNHNYLKNIILSKWSQIQRLCIVWYSGKGKTIRTKISSGLRRELTIKEYLETFWTVGNILYSTCGNKKHDFIFLKMYIQNYIPKWINFALCKLCLSKLNF